MEEQKTVEEKYKKGLEDKDAGLITEQEFQMIEQEFLNWVQAKATSQLLNG